MTDFQGVEYGLDGHELIASNGHLHEALADYRYKFRLISRCFSAFIVYGS